MFLILRRTRRAGDATLGDLYVDGEFQCHTLEDQVRPDPNPATPENEAKVWGQTAIPAGLYKIVISLSNRFGRLMMRLLDVPGFTGILIHGGNTAEDTHGCILVGQKTLADRIMAGTSTPALNSLQTKVAAALAKGDEVTIKIVDAFGEVPHD